MSWIETPESSTISRFSYMSDTLVLTVEFQNGGRYNYFDVPEHMFEELRTAPSKGKYHAQHIKGRFRYARV